MAIQFDETKQIFYLHTHNTSYILGLLNGHLVHLYWGKRLNDIPEPEISVLHGARAQALYTDPLRPDLQSDYLPLEYPTYGHADLRTPAFHAQYEDGSTISEFCYQSHTITTGRTTPEGLPHGRDCGEAETLTLHLSDAKTGALLLLFYHVFAQKDVITRRASIHNQGNQTIRLTCMLSASIDLEGGEFDAITLSGAVQRERYVERRPLSHVASIIDSKRGASGHRSNPFFALADPDTTETHGNVYAMNLLYSGNFLAGAETDCYDNTRFYLGINPFDFTWQLDSGEFFDTPEVVLVYSDRGIGGMSRLFHRFYREHIIHPRWANAHRPVRINSWETAGFDFDEAKLLRLAKQAAAAGVEMLVMDDGWFGKRNDDTCSLGDWYVNKEKLPGGLSSLADQLNAMGMQFGLWLEPEMLSPDSDLYRAHPDWCLHVPGRTCSLGRGQLILDFSRTDVCEYMIETITEILKSANISYIKWDMNRNMTEIGSAALPAHRQRETAHRYILGLYHVLETLTERFPDVCFESCAAGGGRFDGGMLYYTPQIWTSDNSDACDRARIQYGTSLVYPTNTMTAHVSKVPNVVNDRITPLKSRCDIAMLGQFGFEFDPGKLSEEELQTITEATAHFKQYRDIIHRGELYRLSSPFDSNMAVWEFVSEDRLQILVCAFHILSEVNGPFHRLRLQALEPDAQYTDSLNNITMSGAALMQMGIPVRNQGDFVSRIFLFEKLC